MLPIGILGVNHKTADLVLRESAAKAALGLSGSRALFFPHSLVVLSTCNRTEIYFSSDDLARAHSDLLAYLRGQMDGSFEHRLYSYFGNDCFAHLCRVAAGLDSAHVGETEIQRQVKVAYANGYQLPSVLHYLFQKGLKVSKLIRNHLEWEQRSPTLYTTLWKCTEWKNKRILLVGYSEINRGLISFLTHKNIRNLSLCTRNPQGVRWEGIRLYDRSVLQEWDAFDLIVCASRADGYLISGTARREIVIFDLSVPRNVDPGVGAKLYNIDQLVEEKIEEGAPCEDLIWDNVLRLSRIYREGRRPAALLESQPVLQGG